MRITETCGCGASIVASSGWNEQNALNVALDWRRNHRCNPPARRVVGPPPDIFARGKKVHSGTEEA